VADEPERDGGLWALADLATPMAVRVAATLRIADHITQGLRTAAELADRSQVVAGSFFDPLPPGAGGYLLCAVLHNWNDEAARAILRRCAQAAGTDGAVFVVEKIGADGESVGTEMDLRALAYFGGRERGVAELTTLAADAGLDLAAVHPAGTLAIVELTAP